MLSFESYHRILIAPLNWGLGHATRCIPIIQHFLHIGKEVLLGGDGNSLRLLTQHFPTLPTITLPSLELRYSASSSQVGAMLKHLPHLLHWCYQDHHILSSVVQRHHIDLVISDNRFGLYCSQVPCIYITHQLHICLPKGWRWLEPLAEKLHHCIINRYTTCWIPDMVSFPGLAGLLSHPQKIPYSYQYVGVLSRFVGQTFTPDNSYEVVCVLSGLEPQRTLFETELLHRFEHQSEKVLIVQGLVTDTPLYRTIVNITLVSSLPDKVLVPLLLGAKHIIARSGYSTIMDLYVLGLLKKSELVPTSGQSEQEYLATLHHH